MAIGPFLLAAIGGQGGVVIPGAPGTLSLSAGDPVYTAITLSWSAGDNGGGTISGYKIERSTNSGSSWSDLVADTSNTNTTYSNTGLSVNTRYDYRVSAINEIGTGPAGNAPNHTTSAYTAPGAPGTLSLSNGSPSHTAMTLSWSAPSDTGGQAVSGYRIKMGGSVIVSNTGSTSTSYHKTGLSESTSYNFTIAAINSVGTGADGNTPSRSTGANPYVSWSYSGSYTTDTSGSYTRVKCTSTGNFVITGNPNSRTFDQYVVSGGAGGYGHTTGAPGGGGGGWKYFSGQSMSGSTTVTIGAGGTGWNEGVSGNGQGASGGASSCGSNSGVVGGGSSGGTGASSTRDGGSGGGGKGNMTSSVRAGGSGTSGQGEDGGNGTFNNIYAGVYYAGGGGGGAGNEGSPNFGQSQSGSGGIGKNSEIYSTAHSGGGGGTWYQNNVYEGWSYGGGTSDGSEGGSGSQGGLGMYGAGNASSVGNNAGGDGGNNTGGGGGGKDDDVGGWSYQRGGNGGSGVVEIRWTT